MTCRTTPRGITLRIATPRESLLFIDPAGRMVYAYLAPVGWWFHLDGRAVLRSHRDGQRWVRHLSHTATRKLVEFLVRMWTPEVSTLDLSRALHLLEQDRRTYTALYGALPILPPDQYRTVVLQLTRGCPWNRCTFCTFYRSVRYQVRSLEDWTRHVEAVYAWLSPTLTFRDRIFLADASALAVPERRLLRALETVARRFPSAVAKRQLYSFADLPSSLRRPYRTWRKLQEMGLRRVYLGVESGHDGLIRALNKPQTADEVRAAVEGLKAAGMAVGLIFLVGVGGTRWQAPHRDASLRLLEQLPLDEEDQVYLSPYVSVSGGPPGITPGTMEKELQRWQNALKGRPFSVARYDVRLWPVAP